MRSSRAKTVARSMNQTRHAEPGPGAVVPHEVHGDPHGVAVDHDAGCDPVVGGQDAVAVAGGGHERRVEVGDHLRDVGAGGAAVADV